MSPKRICFGDVLVRKNNEHNKQTKRTNHEPLHVVRRRARVEQTPRKLVAVDFREEIFVRQVGEKLNHLRQILLHLVTGGWPVQASPEDVKGERRVSNVHGAEAGEACFLGQLQVSAADDTYILRT